MIMINQPSDENAVSMNLKPSQVGKGAAAQKMSKKNKVKRAFGQDLTNQQSNGQLVNVVLKKGKTADTKMDDVHKNQKMQLEGEDTLIDCKEGDARKMVIEPELAPAEVEEDSKEMAVDEDDAIDIIEDHKIQPWDCRDVDDILCVTDYVNSIMINLREDEQKVAGAGPFALTDFMTFQEDITHRMRTTLVDWLVEVHRKFKLLPATFYLGINLLDRHLEKSQVHRSKLQLLGCTCMWIASKYHEIYAPEMDDFVYISDNAFSTKDLIKQEIDVLQSLDFCLTVPTALSFAQRYIKISAYYLQKEREIQIISDMILYCIEHCLMSYNLCRLNPSLIGAAAFVYACVATKVFTIGTFKEDKLAQAIGYDFDQLLSTMRKINEMVKSPKTFKHKAVFKKYSNAKHSSIAKLNFNKLSKNITFLLGSE